MFSIPRCMPFFFFASYLSFVLFTNSVTQVNLRSNVGSIDRVVVSAPVQVLMAAGDRFLAANLESMRLAATGMDINPLTGSVDGRYLLRAHDVVTRLNACHEDNYYLANAILAWGGADEEASTILLKAAECRYWDFLPPFLYGFNQYFFERNISEARRGLELAAERSSANARLIRRFAIMITAEELDDQAMALAYLEEQKAQTSDKALAASLEDRIRRLEGLIALRNAQEVYEVQNGVDLQSPQQLVNSGLLEAIPEDPLGIGYDFVGGQFKLRQLRIKGVERPQ